MNDFALKLEEGRLGESQIAGYLKKRGFNILPIYEKEVNDFKGPTLFLADGSNIIAPDMLAFKNGKIIWCEAKHKTAFTWHRLTRRWTTGIDTHHFNEYMRLAAISEWPIWLLFLHKRGIAKDTPLGMISPSGLFGGEIFYLNDNINHPHKNHGKHGMVYWAHDKLKKIARLEDMA